MTASTSPLATSASKLSWIATPGLASAAFARLSASMSAIAPIVMLGTAPSRMSFAYIEPWAP